MKKMFMIGLMCAPILAFSQGKTPPTSVQGDPSAKPEINEKTLIFNPETIFADIVITSNPNRGTTIRMDFGRDIMANLTDKDLISEITMLKQQPFPTVPDALNFLASRGWHQISQYMVTTQTGDENRLIMEKKLIKGPGAGSGASSPTRPPAVTKDPGTKPAATTPPPPGPSTPRPERPVKK